MWWFGVFCFQTPVTEQNCILYALQNIQPVSDISCLPVFFFHGKKSSGIRHGTPMLVPCSFCVCSRAALQHSHRISEFECFALPFLRLAESLAFLSATAFQLLFYISHIHQAIAGSSGCQSHKPQLVLVFLLNHQLF